MINAKEASEKLNSMTPADRLEALKNKVSESTRAALDAKILETIAAYERRVDITLSATVCRDPDPNIRALLAGLGYNDISVTSDFPTYHDSYDGMTHIKFSIPNYSSDPFANDSY